MSSHASSSRGKKALGFKVGDRVEVHDGPTVLGTVTACSKENGLVIRLDSGSYWTHSVYTGRGKVKCLEKCLPTSTCFQASAVFPLQQKLLEDCVQPNLSKSTLTHKQFCDPASQESQSTTTSATTIPSLENFNSFRWDFPVLEPAAPDCEPDLTTQNQLCGLKPYAVLQTQLPISSSSKILQGLSTEDYEQFLEDSEWSAIVGTIHKSYQLRNWERPRRGKDFSLLPTPTTYAKGSGKYRPAAGATKLEQSLRQFINPGDKLHPAVPGWMMGFPPGWVEFVLMDGGKTIQPPEIAECAAIPPSAENPTISTPEVSFQSKLRSPSVESCTCPSCEEPLIELEDRCAVGGWVNLPCVSSAKTISSTPGLAKKVLEENKIYSLERFDTERHSRQKVLEEKKSYSLEKTQRKKAPKQTTSHIQVTSTSSGSLYRYLKNIKLKSGEIASYPRVQLVRDPDNLEHWYWGYNYKVLEDGEWRSSSLSVPRVRVRAVQRMIENHAPVAAIKASLRVVEDREPVTLERISTPTEPPCLEKVLEDSSTDSLERNQLTAKPDSLEKVLEDNQTDSLEKFPASGSLYRYLKNKKLKSGAIASYPRVMGARNPDNPNHWYWGYSYEVLEDGEWKGRSLSVPKRKVLAVQAMIDSHKSVAAIKVFIRSN